MLRRLFIGTLAAVILAFAPASAYRHHLHTPSPITSGSLAMFDTESAAQAHCPKDEGRLAEHQQRHLP